MLTERTYSPLAVAVLFNSLPLSGFADGDFITFTPSANVFDTTVGTKGEYAPAYNADRGGTITFRLFAGNRSAIALVETLIRQQEAVGPTNAPLTLTISDASTGERLTAIGCYVETPPTRAFGAAHPVREYTFRCARAEVSAL